MKVVDLFCGAGGFSLGMKQAGHTIVGAFDYEPAVVAVHHANHPDSSHSWIPPRHLIRPFLSRKPGTRDADLQDILEWVPEISQLRPDVIVGGPPCQPWSTSGSRNGDDDWRAILTISFATITAAVQPRYFIMENVPNLEKSDTFLKATTVLRNAGYGLSIRVLSTRSYGSVQERSRLVVAGCKGETEGWLNEYLDEPRWRTDTVVRDVLGDEFGPLLFRRGHYQDGGRRSFFRTDEACPTLTSTSGRGNSMPYELRAADLRVLRSVGEDITSLGKSRNYQPQEGDTIPPTRLPIPNIEQMGLLAGFPADYIWDPIYAPRAEEGAQRPPKPRKASKTAVQKMLGNAVPPPFARALGECLRRYHAGIAPMVQSPEEEIYPDFREWLREKKKLDDADIAAVCRLAERARAIVASRNLGTASDELKAFDIIAARRRSLTRDPDFDAMRQAMFLIYECALNADGLDLEDLDMETFESWVNCFDDDMEFEEEAA